MQGPLHHGMEQERVKEFWLMYFGQYLSYQPFIEFGVRHLVDSGPSLDAVHRDLKKALLCTVAVLAA